MLHCRFTSDTRLKPMCGLPFSASSETIGTHTTSTAFSRRSTPFRPGEWYIQFLFATNLTVVVLRRLNDVPLATYFATHFYFVTYHTFSNAILRKIETRYKPGILRSLFFWSVVFAFAYFTAFMETLTISSFPYYSFQDRSAAYKLGSAFYALYFIVSFPTFYRLENHYDLYRTVLEAFGASMIVLCLLDLVRLKIGIALVIPGKLFYLFKA
jgi:cycloeucalenol cycloisomerase